MKILNLDLSLKHHRYAGARRVREGRDLAHYLGHASEEDRNFAKRLLNMPPMAGGAQQVIFVTTTATALTASQVTYIGPLIGLQQSPLMLCLHYCPQFTSAAAASTITIQMRRTDTPAVISNAVMLMPTGGTNPGGLTLIGYVPLPSVTTTAGILPAGSGIDVQGAASSGSPVPTGSATAPITLGAFGMA